MSQICQQVGSDITGRVLPGACLRLKQQAVSKRAAARPARTLAWNGEDVIAFRVHPGQCQLPRCAALLIRKLPDLLHQLHILQSQLIVRRLSQLWHQKRMCSLTTGLSMPAVYIAQGCNDR